MGKKALFGLSVLFCVSFVLVFAAGVFAQAGKVNINQATQAQLGKIPGVSGELAKASVDQRGKTGAFKTADDLMKVPGMTKETADAMLPAISFGPAKSEAEEEEVKLPRY